LIAGYRYYYGYGGIFQELGEVTYFRSSTEETNASEYVLGLSKYESDIHLSGGAKEIGYSVRCLKD